jgi:hypothetical protein
MKKTIIALSMILMSVAVYAADDGWKSQNNWTLIKPGMSGSQVGEILGDPSRLEGNAFQMTYFYEGTVEGSGFVVGNITFFNGQVQSINKPYFFQQ